ncbi:MAG: sulfurtransferase [Asticcacaulis sp.]
MTAQISVIELKEALDTGHVRVVDGSWALDGTDMKALYLQDHIPSAQFFDLDAISDPASGLPHMAPAPEVFAKAIGGMGIGENDRVVIYDRQGLFSAARVWWTFKLMGHKAVYVLKGGLPAWRAAGYATEAGQPTAAPVAYSATPRPEMVVDLTEMKRIITGGSHSVLDARPEARFAGLAAEPRAGLRSGHMPGSHNLPSGELIANGALKPSEDLRRILASFDLKPETNIVTTCGSGVTAAIIALALHETGYTNVRLYDGSWAQWGQDALDTPVVGV